MGKYANNYWNFTSQIEPSFFPNKNKMKNLIGATTECNGKNPKL